MAATLLPGRGGRPVRAGWAQIAAYEEVWASLDTVALDEERPRRLIGKIIEVSSNSSPRPGR